MEEVELVILKQRSESNSNREFDVQIFKDVEDFKSNYEDSVLDEICVERAGEICKNEIYSIEHKQKGFLAGNNLRFIHTTSRLGVVTSIPMKEGRAILSLRKIPVLTARESLTLFEIRAELEDDFEYETHSVFLSLEESLANSFFLKVLKNISDVHFYQLAQTFEKDVKTLFNNFIKG